MGSHKGLVYRLASSDEASSIGDGLPVMGRPRIFPFYEMEIGQAVIVDGASRGSARSSVQNAQRLQGWKFRTKTLDDGSLLVKRVS